MPAVTSGENALLVKFTLGIQLMTRMVSSLGPLLFNNYAPLSLLCSSPS